VFGLTGGCGDVTLIGVLRHSVIAKRWGCLTVSLNGPDSPSTVGLFGGKPYPFMIDRATLVVP